MKALVHQVVTFAQAPFEGNPAYVLTRPPGLDARLLPHICDQLHGGILAVLDEGASGRRGLCFVTAHGPHEGAGHSAHAAARVALPGNGTVTFDLPGGQSLEAGRIADKVWVRWPIMAAGASTGEGVAEALGRSPSKVLVASFGYVAIYESIADLIALRPDMTSIRRLERSAVIATAPGAEADFALRVFAPLLGLPEDPVCGTAHRIIAPYWAQHLGRTTLHSRQMSPRGGDLWCTVEPSTVVIAGHAHLFLEGSVTVTP